MPEPRNRTQIAFNLRGPEDAKAAPNERVVEFKGLDTQTGGFISIRESGDGSVVVEVYRCHANVVVLARPDKPECLAERPG